MGIFERSRDVFFEDPFGVRLVARYHTYFNSGNNLSCIEIFLGILPVCPISLDFENMQQHTDEVKQYTFSGEGDGLSGQAFHQYRASGLEDEDNLRRYLPIGY